MIYLDHNATTPIAPKALDAMLPYLREKWGNPSSMHRFGSELHNEIEEARGSVADFIGADSSEIVFTGCGTESTNAAIRGAWEAMGESGTIITSQVEHPCVQKPCCYLRERGARLVELRVNHDGQIDLDELRERVAESPTLVSLMWANNETGVMFRMPEIAGIVKEAGGLLHTDAVQAAGKVPINVREVPVDLLSLSGHKLNAPKGVGLLYVRRGTRLTPFIQGGSHESGRRGGTLNVPYIIGFGVACRLANIEDMQTRLRRLRDTLEDELLRACPDAFVNGDTDHRLPNTTSITFPGIEGESFLYHLDDAGIAASSGAACSSGKMEASHVILAMGVPARQAKGAIRFSLGVSNTAAEIDDAIARVSGILAEQRGAVR
jgi:cysteine desulfurase